MTAYTPHTPPMWRRVFSLPHTRLGWWAVGLSAVSVPLFLWLNLFAGFGPSLVGTLPDPHRLVPPWLGVALTVLALIMVIMVLMVPCVQITRDRRSASRSGGSSWTLCQPYPLPGGTPTGVDPTCAT
jgi:hypothetical protein